MSTATPPGSARLAPGAQPTPQTPSPALQRTAQTPAEPLAASLPPAAMWLVLGTLLGAVLLNLHHTALWCAPLALVAAAWRARAGATPPSRRSSTVRIVLVLVLTAGAFFSLRSHGGLGAAATLLVVMGAMKLSETVRLRDWLIVLSTAVFLLLAACLDAQSLWRLPMYAAELWLVCAALYALGAGNSPLPLGALLRSAARSLVVALPLALLLFLFFPRLAGAFWAIPQQGVASTGLGDDMSPGSITRLVQSDDPALRVRFDGTLPPPYERYWRGLVLHDFDGFTWRRRSELIGETVAPLHPTGPGYHYEVTLEPSIQNVLIALELPQGLPQPPEALPTTFETFDHQLLATRRLLRSVNYALTSYPQHRSSAPLSTIERGLDLALPPQRNPRTLQLAQQLRAGARDDAAYVAAVLNFLHGGGFSYTLTPPALGLDSIDDLLFHTHQGFCEHYASAFATLMRAGGVPARVVTGYLGGEWNRFGHYLLISQADAHAWTEVWLAGHGWVRVDPTAVVSPSSLGLELNGQQTPFGGLARLRDAPWLRLPIQAWQATNAWWEDRVVSFNFTRQLDLLNRLGLGEQQRRGLVELLAVGAALWLALIAWGLRPRTWNRSADPLTQSWRLLERKLGRAVGARAQHEGPIAYAQRVGRAHPELARSLQIFARRFAQLRYGPAASASELEHFRRAVRQWQPRYPRPRPQPQLHATPQPAARSPGRRAR
jgi:protein-glutamine gamma-glutamyltransferase